MLRVAKHQDAKQIAELLSTFGDEIFTLTGAKINTDKELIQKLFNDSLGKEFRAFVYEVNDKIIGFITFSDSFSLYAEGHYITITELYVDEKYRSKEIGKELLNAVVDTAKTENKTHLELTTPPLPIFQRSLDFYLNNGFEVTGGKKVKLEIAMMTPNF